MSFLTIDAACRIIGVPLRLARFVHDLVEQHRLTVCYTTYVVPEFGNVVVLDVAGVHSSRGNLPSPFDPHKRSVRFGGRTYTQVARLDVGRGARLCFWQPGADTGGAPSSCSGWWPAASAGASLRWLFVPATDPACRDEAAWRRAVARTLSGFSCVTITFSRAFVDTVAMYEEGITLTDTAAPPRRRKPRRQGRQKWSTAAGVAASSPSILPPGLSGTLSHEECHHLNVLAVRVPHCDLVRELPALVTRLAPLVDSMALDVLRVHVREASVVGGDRRAVVARLLEVRLPRALCDF